MAGAIDYDTIFEIYSVTSMDPKVKHRIRQRLRAKLEEYLEKENMSGTAWEDLSQIQRDYFICFYIKKYLLKSHPDVVVEKVEKNIQNYLKKSMLSEISYLNNRNEQIPSLWKRHSSSHNGIYTKEESYEQFCEDLKNYNSAIPVPTYEQYAKKPMRVYDYIQSISFSTVDQNSINNVLIRIILQVLEREIGLKVNYSLIEECLSTVLNPDIPEMELFEFEEFPKAYNEEMGMSEKEFYEIRDKYNENQRCLKMLQDLTKFYEIDDKKCK